MAIRSTSCLVRGLQRDDLERSENLRKNFGTTRNLAAHGSLFTVKGRARKSPPALQSLWGQDRTARSVLLRERTCRSLRDALKPVANIGRMPDPWGARSP